MARSHINRLSQFVANDVEVGDDVSVAGSLDVSDGMDVTGNFEATGTITGADISTTGDVGCDNIVATGAIECDNIDVTGDVGTTTVTATGAISGDSLSITNDVGCVNVVATGDVQGLTLTSTSSVSGVTLDISSTAEIDGDVTITPGVVKGGCVVGESFAERWDDLRVAISTAQAGQVNPPTLAKFRDNGAGSDGVFARRFSNSQDEDILFETQMPHDWEPESTIYFHVHWSPGASGVAQSGKSVRWRLEYTKSDNNGNAIPLTQFVNAEDTVTGTDYAGEITGDNAITMTGCDSSCVLICRLYRDNSIANNAAAPMWGLSVDFHYKRVALGTVNHIYPFGGN